MNLNYVDLMGEGAARVPPPALVAPDFPEFLAFEPNQEAARILHLCKGDDARGRSKHEAFDVGVDDYLSRISPLHACVLCGVCFPQPVTPADLCSCFLGAVSCLGSSLTARPCVFHSSPARGMFVHVARKERTRTNR